MKKLAAKIVLLATMLLCLLGPAGIYLDHFFSSRFRSEKDFWVMNQKDTAYDFAVMGSSRAYNNIDINEMRQVLGRTGINLGVAGTGYEGMSLVLSRFFNNGNRIKILLIQVDIFGFDSRNSYSNPFPVHMYLPFLNADIDVDRIVRDNSAPLDYFLWKQVPFAKYLEFNTEYLRYLIRYIRPRFEAELTANCGTQLLGVNEPGTFRFKSGSRKIVMDDYDNLIKIITLARRKGAAVVMFTSPQFHDMNRLISTYPTYTDVLDHVVSQHGVPFLTVDDADFSRSREFFVDYTHTNSHGSKIFSRMLAKRLKTSLSIP